mmetsp:Transcript_13602/g.22359  ORF Transcript_13602/g.22359 Transcript_13602/m.22359 type:complete len:80 (+) Transcript_13602:92-331(+)
MKLIVVEKEALHPHYTTPSANWKQYLSQQSQFAINSSGADDLENYMYCNLENKSSQIEGAATVTRVNSKRTHNHFLLHH